MTIVERAAQIIAEKSIGGNAGFCTLAQLTPDGYPTAATISISKSEGIKWLTMCSGLESNWALRARADARSCVCVNSDMYNISLIGKLEIITDADIKREMWYGGLENHFSGPEDPNYCVFRLNVERYSILLLDDNSYETGTL